MVPVGFMATSFSLTCLGAASNFCLSGFEVAGFMNSVFKKQGPITIRATPYQEIAPLLGRHSPRCACR